MEGDVDSVEPCLEEPLHRPLGPIFEVIMQKSTSGILGRTVWMTCARILDWRGESFLRSFALQIPSA